MKPTETTGLWPDGYASAGYSMPNCVMLCTRCGAIVMARLVHDSFHEAMSRPGATACSDSEATS